MNPRIVAVAFVVGLAGGCSFSSQFEDYCRNSGKCTCTGAQCCVVAGEECDAALGCCGGLTCGPDTKCSAPAGGGGGVTGGGGGATGGGGGATGGGGGATGGGGSATGGGGSATGGGGSATGGGGSATGGGGGVTGGGGGGATGGGGGVSSGPFLLDGSVSVDGGGFYAAGLSLALPGGGFPNVSCGNGGLVPTWIHGDAGVTVLECCHAGDAGTCIGDAGSTCTLPGYRSTSALPCCFCDGNCSEPPNLQICPSLQPTQIDVAVEPVWASQLPPEMLCAGGDLRALEGCCTPDQGFTSCSYLGGVSCTLDTAGSPCCFVAWVGSPHASGPILLNDCRANGSCECNSTGGCGNTAGTVCVDIQGR